MFAQKSARPWLHLSVCGAVAWAMVSALHCSPAEARFDDGGWMSRDLVVGVYDDGGVEVHTVYATTREDGDPNTPESNDPVTLWAFCPPHDETAPATPVEERCRHVLTKDGATCEALNQCDAPCKWKASVPMTGSGKDSFAPPAVNPFGDRIYVLASKGDTGKIFAYDNCGDLKWEYDAPLDGSIDTAKNGFYAKPVVYQPGEMDLPVLFAINVGNNGKSYLHAIEDHGDHWEPWGAPVDWVEGNPWNSDAEYPLQVPLVNVLFGPLLDTECEDCSTLRIYLAADDTSAGIWAYDADPSAQGPSLAWCTTGTQHGTCHFSPFVTGEAMRLGGVIVRQVKIGVGLYTDMLITSSHDDIMGFYLDDNHGGVVGELSDQQPIQQFHRSVPTLSVNEREPEHVLATSTDPVQPVVYLTSRNGTQQLWRVDPEASSDRYQNVYPHASDPGLGNSSYSWAVPDPRTGHVFWGGAKTEGIHRVNRRIYQHPDFVDEKPATEEWFDYLPPNAWRTAPAFSYGGEWLHIGSAEGRFYNMDPDGPRGRVLSCFDTKAGEGSECTGLSTPDNKPCCTHMLARHQVGGDLVCWKPDPMDTTVTTACDHSLEVLSPSLVNGSIDYSTLPQNGSVLVWVNYKDDASGLPAAAAVTEIVNETSGAYLTPVAGFFGGYVITVPLPADPVNPANTPRTHELRFAAFDNFGNELSTRIRITNAP